jgi:hypothetical protein
MGNGPAFAALKLVTIWLPRTFATCPFYVMLYPMGNKDRGKKEVKKAPKPKPKPEIGRREVFTPSPK